jgi:hypothetical protein
MAGLDSTAWTGAVALAQAIRVIAYSRSPDRPPAAVTSAESTPPPPLARGVLGCVGWAEIFQASPGD